MMCAGNEYQYFGATSANGKYIHIYINLDFVSRIRAIAKAIYIYIYIYIYI